MATISPGPVRRLRRDGKNPATGQNRACDSCTLVVLLWVSTEFRRGPPPANGSIRRPKPSRHPVQSRKGRVETHQRRKPISAAKRQRAAAPAVKVRYDLPDNGMERAPPASERREQADAALEISLGPQRGPQKAFKASRAHIAIYGGAAGGGKTWALLMQPMKHRAHDDFAAVGRGRLSAVNAAQRCATLVRMKRRRSHVSASSRRCARRRWPSKRHVVRASQFTHRSHSAPLS